MSWNLHATGTHSDTEKVKQMAEAFFAELAEAGAQVSSFSLASDGVDVLLNTPGVRNMSAVAAGTRQTTPQPSPGQVATSPTPQVTDEAEGQVEAQPASRPTARPTRSGPKSR